jgi:hypothetical protein
MNATIFNITEKRHMTDKMTVKACKTSKQTMVQLLQTGTDEKTLFKNRIPGITHILQFD